MNPNLLNASVLAYLGDSYYEHHIRLYLVKEGITRSNELHKNAVKFTSGESQAQIIKYFIEEKILSEEEFKVYKRGRNISGGSRKNLSLIEVHESTGFEALIGYLSLSDQERAIILINLAINYIKGE